MGKLIESDDLGNWGVKGLPWNQLHVGCVISKEVHDKLYGCLWKLMEYESTGLTPQEVEECKKEKIIKDFVERLKEEYKPCKETDTEIYEKVCNRIDKIAEEMRGAVNG